MKNKWTIKRFGPSNGKYYYTIMDGDKIVANTEDYHYAHLIVAVPALKSSLKNMLDGWKYIRYTYGELKGVHWDRDQNSAENAIAESEKET